MAREPFSIVLSPERQSPSMQKWLLDEAEQTSGDIHVVSYQSESGTVLYRIVFPQGTKRYRYTSIADTEAMVRYNLSAEDTYTLFKSYAEFFQITWKNMCFYYLNVPLDFFENRLAMEFL